MKNILLSIYLILLLSMVGLSQSNFRNISIEKRWKGIEPLVTDKIKVNNLLGTPEIDNNYYGYLSNEAFVRVNYSTMTCQDKQGKYNISKGTVLDYVVNIKQPVKLSEVKYNHKKYKKDTSGDVGNVAMYRNEEDGVWIEVGISREGIEYVKTIYYYPTKKKAQKLKCKS